jgi:hypothetical protein
MNNEEINRRELTAKTEKIESKKLCDYIIDATK